MVFGQPIHSNVKPENLFQIASNGCLFSGFAHIRIYVGFGILQMLISSSAAKTIIIMRKFQNDHLHIETFWKNVIRDYMYTQPTIKKIDVENDFKVLEFKSYTLSMIFKNGNGKINTAVEGRTRVLRIMSMAP